VNTYAAYGQWNPAIVMDKKEILLSLGRAGGRMVQIWGYLRKCLRSKDKNKLG